MLLLLHAPAGCSGKEKLIDAGGLPQQLSKVKCGSTEEDVLRAYPDFAKTSDGYSRTTANASHRLTISIRDGKVLGGAALEPDSAGASFKKRLEQLESQLGKGSVREGTKNKTFEWEPSSGRVERVFLVGTEKTIALATYCRAAEPEPSSPSTQAPERPDSRCDSVLNEYQVALGVAGASAEALERDGCAQADSQGTLVPATQPTAACQALWNQHFVNAQHAIDLNDKARTACPEMKLGSMGAVPASLRIDANSITSVAAGSAAQPSTVTKRTVLTADSVRAFVKAQADSLTSTGTAFVESFDVNAVAFFPQSQSLYEGRDRIVDGSRAAWGQGAPENVDAADVVVGVFPDFAWVTTQWKITLADKKTVLPVRVTEVLSDDPPGSLRVVAASFSVALAAGKTGIGEPVPAIATGESPKREPDTWLASPIVLASHVHNDLATAVIGSDAKEVALGPDEARRLLGGWKNVRLEFVGNALSIDGAGFRVVAGYARWRGKATLFRVLALFVPADNDPTGMEPLSWALATAHYSVAVAQDRSAARSADAQHSASFTISIRDKDGDAGPYTAALSVEGPGTNATVMKRANNDSGFAEAVFPRDFGAKLVPGEYRWKASVAGAEVARGSFVVASDAKSIVDGGTAFSPSPPNGSWQSASHVE